MTGTLTDAKKAYKAKDYQKAYEIYTELYDKIPFDNSARYSYAWAIYQAKIKDFQSKEELLKDTELITRLTKQQNLNRTKLCVYTMSVLKVIKLLYNEKDYEELPYWLEKINPDLLDQVRFTKDGQVYPSNMEQYYVHSSVTYFNIGDYEKCIEVSKKALGTLFKFTGNNLEYFQWRIAKSLRQIGDYNQALKYLKILRLDEWYVEHEIAENYFYLEEYDESLKYAVKSALHDGPMDMKFNLYTLMADLLYDDYPEYAQKHEELCDLIRNDDDMGKSELEDELLEFWKKLEEVEK